MYLRNCPVEIAQSRLTSRGHLAGTLFDQFTTPRNANPLDRAKNQPVQKYAAFHSPGNQRKGGNHISTFIGPASRPKSHFFSFAASCEYRRLTIVCFSASRSIFDDILGLKKNFRGACQTALRWRMREAVANFSKKGNFVHSSISTLARPNVVTPPEPHG